MRWVRCVRVCLSACLPHRPNGTSARESAVTLTSRAAPQSLDCVRARPFRVPALFASVRSARGRCGARWHVCVLASASVVAPPTRNRLSPGCAMHPPLRCAWLGRDTSLRQSPPSRRRLSHRGGGLRSGPAPPLRPLDTLVDAGFHSGASVPLAPAHEPCRGFAQHLAPGGPRPIAAAVVGCNGREV